MKASCDDAPTYVTESLVIPTNTSSRSFSNYLAGGYAMDGLKITGNFSVPIYDPTANVTITSKSDTSKIEMRVVN